MTQPTADLAALLAEGRLAEAIGASTARLKASAVDTAARANLAELLCLAGDFDRAEAQLAILAQQTIDRPVAIARMRHLIRAALAREAWFNSAAVPTLVTEPGPGQQAALRLAIAMQAGPDEVAAALEAAEAARCHPSGHADGVPFDDLRDADDRCAWFLDILTMDGNYVWVDLAAVESLVFTPLGRPVDLLWREARLGLADGRVADVVVPAQYVCPRDGSTTVEEEHRLAARTDWRDGPGGAVLGLGQRLWLVGDDAKPILELTELVFDRPAKP